MIPCLQKATLSLVVILTACRVMCGTSRETREVRAMRDGFSKGGPADIQYMTGETHQLLGA